jgi:hypothetical protein
LQELTSICLILIHSYDGLLEETLARLDLTCISPFLRTLVNRRIKKAALAVMTAAAKGIQMTNSLTQFFPKVYDCDIHIPTDNQMAP